MAHLRPIDKEFEDADDTGVLVLSSRNLRNFPVVPGDLCDFTDLLEADFGSNRFDHIPQEVCDFRELVRLSFYRNLLRLVPEELRHLENLKDLNLSRNLLPTIPLGLCHMHLHSLNLSNNRLVSLPLLFGNLKQLRYLNLSCNHLPDLPPSIVELSALQHLDLHRNQLRELPAEIQMLALRYLDISCNQITALPSTLRHIADTLKIFKMTDNPIESPPTQVCVRGLMHIVKWMEGMEKHGSDPHLLSTSSLSSRDASLARRGKGKRQSTASRSFIDSAPQSTENGILDEMTNLMNSSLRGVEPPPLTKNDGEITPTHTSTPMHWSLAQVRATPASAMSDQSKEEYREAAQKLYLQQERQKNRLNRRKRASSPIQATAKAAVTLSKQQSGSTEFNSLPRRTSKEEMMAAQTAPSFSSTPTSGGTKSLEGSPKVGPPSRSLPGEKNPRPGSWNSHVKVTSSPILPSKYALPANEKTTSEDDASSTGSSGRGGADSEDEATRKKPPPPQTTAKPDAMIRRSVGGGDVVRTRPQPDKVYSEETHRKPPPQETTSVTPSPSPSPSSPSSSSSSRDHLQQQQQQQQHLSVVHQDRSSAPHFDRSDSVTPTNELADEESLTPRSKEGVKDAGKTLAAASLKLQEQVGSLQSDSVKDDGEKKTKKKKKKEQSTTTTNGVISAGTGGESVKSGGEARREVQSKILEPPTKMKRTPSSESDSSDVSQKDSTWPRSIPPRKKKEKDVFRFLKEEHDVNYTVRRQEFQMSRVIEKCRSVKEKIAELLGLELADDIGEWVTDGVVPCQLVKKLHPQLMATFHSPAQGKELSRGRKTVNIANFIAACRQLHVPEEELCSAGDIIELKDPVRVVTCLQRVLESADIMVMSP